MRRPNTWQALGLATLLLVFFSGCPQAENGPPAKPSGSQPGGTETPPGPDQSAGQPEKKPEPEPPPPLTVPEVHMPESLRQTCLVFVGDAMPAGELTDLDGNTKSLESLRGEKLTAILFWTRGEDEFAQIAATAALEDLQKDVAEPYGSKGVAVVAINVRNSAEDVRQSVEEAGAKYPNFVDPEGKYFAQVATEGLPRVYLLDATGKIVWLDAEFSRTSRRDLLQAIQVELGEI